MDERQTELTQKIPLIHKNKSVSQHQLNEEVNEDLIDVLFEENSFNTICLTG